MAQYADINKFNQILKTNKYGETTITEVGIALEKSTADVAPRTEVEKLTEELDKYKVMNKLLEQDVADWQKLAESRVEEIHPEFMRDYNCMREELEGLYDEFHEAKTEIENLAAWLKTERKSVAVEIFEELEREINDALQSNYKVLPVIEESEALWNRVSGKIDALRGIGGFIDKLKKKYTEGQ